MNLKPPFDRITIEPGKMGGQPCIRGMRITVRRVLELLGTYQDCNEIVAVAPIRRTPSCCTKPVAETDQCLWFGDNPRQGIAVVANGVNRA